MSLQTLLQKMVQTLGTYIHDASKKQLVEAIKSIKMDMEYDSQTSAELLTAIFRFPDAVHKSIVSTAAIQPHWMFALDSLLRSAVQAAVTILEPDVGANLEGSMGTPASGSAAIVASAAYIGRAGNGAAAMAIALQARALERRATLSPADEGDDEAMALVDGSEPVLSSVGEPPLTLAPLGRPIAMSISGRLDQDAPSPDPPSDALDLSADSSQPQPQHAAAATPLYLVHTADSPFHYLASTLPGPATGTVRERSGSFARRRPAPVTPMSATADSQQHTCACCLAPTHVHSPLASSQREEPPVAPAHQQPSSLAQPSLSSAVTVSSSTDAAAAGTPAPPAGLPLPEEHSTSGVSTLDSNHSGIVLYL